MGGRGTVDQSTRPQAPLCVHALYEHDGDRAAAESLGRALYDRLTRKLGAPLAFGPNILVRVAAVLTELSAVDARINLYVPVGAADAEHADLVARIRARDPVATAAHVLPIVTPAAPSNNLAHWDGVVLEVALAAGRLLQGANDAPSFSLLHSGGADAHALVGALQSLGCGFVAHDLEPRLHDEGRLVGSSLLICIRDDELANRPDCQLVVLDAKARGLPVLAVDIVRESESRTFPYLGNVRMIRPLTDSPPPVVVAMHAAVEWLHAVHFRKVVTEYLEEFSQPEVLIRPPELVDLAQGPLLSKPTSTVIHPDPELPMAERELLRTRHPRIKLVTPATMFRSALGNTLGRGWLTDRSIAFALSASPDTATNKQGFTQDHLIDATIGLARDVICAGGAIAYGGDFRRGGFSEPLSQLVVGYNQARVSTARLLQSYRPADEVVPAGERVVEIKSLRDLKSPAPLLSAPDEKVALDAPVYLSDLRRVMALDCLARISIGGQTYPRRNGSHDGYNGAFPGVLEEAWWSLHFSKPLYIVGGFGGAAATVAELLQGRQPGLPSGDAFPGDDYSDYRARCARFATHPAVEELKVPKNMAEMADALQALGKQVLADDASARAFNGLTVAENLALFSTRDPQLMRELTMRGLFEVAKRGQGQKLRVELVRGSITQVEQVDAVAVAIFEDVPMAGAAGGLDALLSGRLSRARAAGAKLVDVTSTALDARWICLQSLGALVTGTELVSRARQAASSVADAIVRHGFERVAIVSFGASLGGSLPEEVSAIVDGLAKISQRTTLQWFELNTERFQQLAGLLREHPGVEVSTRALTPPAMTTNDSRGLSTLLSVRYGDGKLTTTLIPPLGSGVAAAAAQSFEGKLEELSQKLFLNAKNAPSPVELKELGESLERMLLSEPGRTLLTGDGARHAMVVQHDMATGMFPFETLTLASQPLSVAGGMVRRPGLELMTAASMTPRPAAQNSLKVLLVVNPTGDLDTAEQEAELVEQSLKASNLEVVKLVGAEATVRALREHLAEPDVDVLHFCGHAALARSETQKTGLRCHGDAVFGVRDLERIGTLPRMVFFNACESARLQAMTPAEAASIFAETVLRGAVVAYLGTFWPVGTQSAANFASRVYLELSAGATLAYSVHAARKELHDAGNHEWANYLLYGDGEHRLVQLK